MPKHPPTVTLSDFKGLDNKNPDNRTSPNFLTTAMNIDVDSLGSIRKRLGYASIVAGSNMHSLWGDNDSLYFFNDGDLTQLNADGTTTVLGQNYPYLRTDFHKVGDRIFFASTGFTGVIDNGVVRPWGIETPSTIPTLVCNRATAQAAITYVSDDGRESGATLAASDSGADISRRIHYFQDFEQSTNLTLTDIPSSIDPTVVAVRVYITLQNGEELMLAKEITNGLSTTTANTSMPLSIALMTQFVSAAPKGDIVEYYNGRMYIANQDVLWYSEPQALEWFKLGSNFITFPSPITNIMPVDDGIFITADKLYFLEGNGPENFRLRDREAYKAAKYTAVRIVGSDVVIENIPTGMKWLFNSDKGFIMVGTGGMVFNLTEKNVMIDEAEEGAAFFRSDEGMNQYVSVLKDPENNRTHVGDQAEAQVVRNGIVIT